MSVMKIRNLKIGRLIGLILKLKRRFGLRPVWHATLSRNRKVIKMTGVWNDPDKTFYYPSVYHLIHDIPSLFKMREFDYLVAQSYLHEEFLSCRKPKLFFTCEPPASMTPETRNNIKREQLKPHIYSFDEPDIEKRMFYYALPPNKNFFIKKLERTVTVKRNKLCCIINRYSENKSFNLVLKRIEFVKAMGVDIDIYGAEPWGCPNKWESFPNYYGRAGNKLETLGRYNFVLAFENTDYPGYITEKIIHAFQAGTVPLYWGGGEYLKESIPSNCFIDCRDQDPHRIYQMIKNMTEEEIISFRKAAIDFLKSDAADRFTRRHWAEEVVKRLESLSSS